MLLSLLAAFLMLIGKLWAYFVTGSAAIFSDAAESVIHLMATGFVVFSFWFLQQPPDESHPYGHGKVAYFSAGLEGGLIAVAALIILYSAGRDLVLGPEVQQLSTGLLVTALLSGVNLLLGGYLVHTGRRYNSLVLVSNGKHVLTDMWTSFGVVVGVGVVWLTGHVWIDPVVAIIVALNILWTAYSLLKQAVEGLMEKARREDTEAIVHALEEARREGTVANYHQLRHRRVNNELWVEYHLLMSGELSITEAHERAHWVEEAVIDQFPDDQVYVTAHLEPRRHEAAHPGGHFEPIDPLRELASKRSRT